MDKAHEVREGLRDRVERRVATALRGGSSLVRSERGMTLIEIMVVIAIIGILMSAITFGVFTYLKKAKVDAAKAQLRKVGNVLTIYAAEDDFPNTLSVLTESTSLGPAPLKEKDLKDPWKQDLIYTYPSQRGDAEFDLCSSGPDKQQGTEDDVCLDD